MPLFQEVRMTETILDRVKGADMVLVGLGEAFDPGQILKTEKICLAGAEALRGQQKDWLIPAFQSWYQGQMPSVQEELRQALEKLADLLEGKNYFVVSVSVNDLIREIPWRENRLTMPCGGSRRKQCDGGCDGILEDVTAQDREAMDKYFKGLMEFLREPPGEAQRAESAYNGALSLGTCPVCGKPLILNNVHAPYYNESDYLPAWQLYTKWLQGTLHKDLVILELGVGMRFPSVVRWPFEKTAFFNQKAYFCRVNETLYQVPEELREKSVTMARNPVDWLLSM